MSSERHFAIGELSRRAGVSRRTVRFYVQRGLIPPPYGLGRGDHYGEEHLAAVLRVKALQERGLSLEEIRLGLGLRREPAVLAETPTAVTRVAEEGPRYRSLRAPQGEVWVRHPLLPGVELHVRERERELHEDEVGEIARFLARLLAARREEP